MKVIFALLIIFSLISFSLSDDRLRQRRRKIKKFPKFPQDFDLVEEYLAKNYFHQFFQALTLKTMEKMIKGPLPDPFADVSESAKLLESKRLIKSKKSL